MTAPFGYRATRDEAGVLTIHHVPIFVECSRGASTFDGAWLASAVAKAKQAEGEGYLPPLHVRHHDSGQSLTDNVRAAGFFRVVGVEPITFKGTRRMAVFADLVITDPMVREDVLAKRLPYRSVEIFDVADPALDSLALLDHEAPYLELPMLMVAEVAAANGGNGNAKPVAQVSAACATFANPWRSPGVDASETLVACFRRGQSARLFFEEPEPMTTLETPAKFADAPKDAPPKDAPKGGKDPAKMADGAPDVGAIVKAIADGSISVADMDALLQAIQAQRASKPDSGATTSAPAPAAAPAPGESMTKGPMTESLARVAGENAALKARLDDRDATDKRRDDVDAALRRLEGRPLGADPKAELVAFHKAYGPLAFAAYVDSMAKTFGSMPRNGGNAAAGFVEQTGGEGAPATALAFQAHGTDAVTKAARFSREWRDLNERGMVRVDEARYVAINMEKHGVKIAAKG